MRDLVPRLIRLSVMVVIVGAAFQVGALSSGVSTASDVDGVPLASDPLPHPQQRPHSEGASPTDGIRVHGDWTIEIYEPDGTLASRHEFTNAFVGASSLRDILARTKSVTEWRLNVFGNELGVPCSGDPSFGRCKLVESNNGLTGSYIHHTLIVSAPTSGPDASKLILEGTATAENGGTITRVGTRVGGGIAAGGTYIGGFTSTTTNIPIAAGQSFVARVVISFS